MKNKFLFITFLLTTQLIYAQTDTTRLLLVKYDFSILRDTTDTNSQRFTDIMTLDISKSKTKFYSYLKHLGIIEYRKSSPPTVFEHTITVKNAPAFGSKESEVIIIDYETKTYRVYDRLSKKPQYYEDSLIIPKWVLWPDTAIILNQPCQKATAFYRGRNIIAWFAKNIPLQRGPWLYNGLPGLILKVEDTRNQLSFVCRELVTKPTEEPAFVEYKDPEKISKVLALKRKRLSVEDPLTFHEKEWGVTISYGDNKPRKKGHYNPIELQ